MLKTDQTLSKNLILLFKFFINKRETDKYMIFFFAKNKINFSQKKKQDRSQI